MGHQHRQQPEHTDHDALVNSITSREPYLTEDVRLSKLDTYTDKALEGRFNEYLKLYTFERDPVLRAEYRAEYQRTEAEIKRRTIKRRSDALQAAEI